MTDRFSVLDAAAANAADDLAFAERRTAIERRDLTDLEPAHREYLIGQLSCIFKSYQQPGLAEELLDA